MTAAGCAIGTVGAASAADASPYKDVKKSWWSYPQIMYVTENGYMNGTGGGKFEPQGTMTRAMVVTVLYRFQNEPEVEFKAKFKDVKAKDWFANAVIWAEENGIVNGIEEGKFAPNESITRQQLAAILMRYAPQEYIKTDGRKDITGYSDYKKVQSYARDAMSWANSVGLITGVTKKTLEPASSATREQVATILQRFKTSAAFEYELVYNTPTVSSTYTEKPYELISDADIYVAVDGTDTNPGTIDKPICSFERAVEMVRELKKTAKDEIVVAFKAGNYGSLEGLTLTAADSGTADVPIRYCAYGDGDVVFSNGITLPSDKFVPIEDGDKYLFTEKNYGSIYKMSLDGYVSAGSEISSLFADGGICHEARFPNKDENGIDMFYTNMTTTVDKYSSIRLQALLPKIVAGFRTTEGMKISGHLRTGWLIDTFKVKSYDPETNIVVFDIYEGYMPDNGYRIGESHGGFDLMYEGRVDDTVYFSNLSDQLDSDGEYWSDTKTNTLYVYEPSGDYTVALGGTFINAEDSSYISFVGLTFDGCTDTAMICNHTDHITIDRCTIGNIAGEYVVNGYKAKNFTLRDSELYSFGAMGVSVKPHAGDKQWSLESAHTLIENNYFHDFGFINSWSSAVQVGYDVGARVAHNLFERGAHGGVDYGDLIDSVFEYNIFDSMMLTTADFGALYTCDRFTTRSNVVRYNMFRNIPAGGAQYGIYLDGASNGTEIYGNLFYNAGSSGVTINGGRDNNIHDNVYITTHSGGRFLFANLNPETKKYLDSDGSYTPSENNEVTELATLIPQAGDAEYDTWRAKWPLLYTYHTDISKLGEIECYWTTVNYVSDNYQIGDRPISERSYLLYGVGAETNKVIGLDENPIFADPTHGDYTIVGDTDIALPISEMGRY